jgi:hypothetical protein
MRSASAAPRTTIRRKAAPTRCAGFTQQNTRYDRKDMNFRQQVDYAGIEGYRTGASTVSVAYRPLAGLELTGAYTRLTERNAILGVQALSSDMIGQGATTDGMTLGATWQAAPTLQVAASATMGRTRSDTQDALISTGAGGFRTSAWQVTVAKQHLVDGKDALRLSLAQPLHVDQGSLDITSLQVIDRQTGALGLVTERFALPGARRPLVGEFQYARTLMDGQADLALFGKARLRGEQPADQAASLRGGARSPLRY